jgi:hypothetical protein
MTLPIEEEEEEEKKKKKRQNIISLVSYAFHTGQLPIIPLHHLT